jgi:DNA-directed RNA polymerase specialized sigma24 family protein
MTHRRELACSHCQELGAEITRLRDQCRQQLACLVLEWDRRRELQAEFLRLWDLYRKLAAENSDRVVALEFLFRALGKTLKKASRSRPEITAETLQMRQAGMSIDEIARKLHRSPEAIRKRLSRARRRGQFNCPQGTSQL